MPLLLPILSRLLPALGILLALWFAWNRIDNWCNGACTDARAELATAQGQIQAAQERATALADVAGVGVMRNVWSNAMIAFDAGTPWREVNYALLRAAIRVDQQRSGLSALRSRLWRAYERRRYPERRT